MMEMKKSVSDLKEVRDLDLKLSLRKMEAEVKSFRQSQELARETRREGYRSEQLDTEAWSSAGPY